MTNKKFYLVIMLLLSCAFIGGCTQTDEGIITNFFKTLSMPAQVQEDLPLNSTYDYKGNTINVTWTTTDENIISVSGKVTFPNVDTTVIIVANATLNEVTKTKAFTVVVSGDDTASVLEAATNSLVISSVVDSSLSLPTTKTVLGKTVSITWESSNTDIFTNAGVVTLGTTETTINLTATFSYNNKSVQKVFTFSVPKNPDYYPVNTYHLASVYKGEIENEVAPTAIRDFAGAIYRKVVSSRDNWLGIEVVVTLPEFVGDLQEPNPHGNAGDMRYLDNASVYLGANCEHESDVGLTWTVGSKDAAKTSVDWSQSVAYRPFWRYITSDYKNTYENASWSNTEYYYYPGDTVRMSVIVSNTNYMQLRVELLEETTIEKYAARRNSYNLGENYSKVFVSKEYESRGAGIFKTIFKRVCALDQTSNEGKPTRPTNAKSLNTIWRECYLYREINGTVYKVPMTSDRVATICSPSGVNSLGDFTNTFKITTDGVDASLGGEVVTIDPNNRK